MTWLLMNIPLMVLFVALWAGIPAWLVLRRPDRKPEPEVAASATVSTLPARRYEEAGFRRVA